MTIPSRDDAERIARSLRAMALFYAARPCVDEQKTVPKTQEISRRECLEIAVLMRGAANVIEAAERRGEARGLRRAAEVAAPPLWHRKGKPGLWRQRRAAIASAIRTLASSLEPESKTG